MKSYKILALLEKVEPLKKGDQRVLINGTPCKVNFRIISDDLFTDAVKSFKETLAELERVKTTRDQYFKAAIHAQDKLTQAEKERDELRERNNTALKLKENALTLYERMSNELIQKSNNFYGVEEENKKLRKFVQKIVDSKSLTLEQLGLVLLDFQTKAQQLLTP